MMARRIEPRHPDRFHIGGEWVAPADTRTFDVRDCTTEEVAATLGRAES